MWARKAVGKDSSFVTPEDIYELIEGMLARVFETATGSEVPAPFPRITYREAMDRWGSDRPERRIGTEIVDFSDVFANSGFGVFAGAIKNGGVVRAINAKSLMAASVRENGISTLRAR